jgi:hypothetical protein
MIVAEVPLLPRRPERETGCRWRTDLDWVIVINFPHVHGFAIIELDLRV